MKHIQETNIERLLKRGVDEVIEFEHLKNRLESGEKLRVKFGIDPTAPDLHLGHTVPLQKLRQFQDLGHAVIFLVGDYTAMIGDPTGRNITRPILSEKDVKRNMKTYIKQAGKVLNTKKLEIRYNSEWYGKPNVTGLLMEITSKITVARILERDDFQKRIKEGVDIQMQEIMYPLLQGYDSVALKANVEIGGTDQKFNMLMGRKIQKRYSMAEQDVITVPLIEGLDGKQKMSKSLGNFIALTEDAESMYGKIMSLPDDLIGKYFTLLTNISLSDIEAIQEVMRSGEINPRDAKMRLARTIVALYHDTDAALEAEKAFVRLFQKHEAPEDMPVARLAGKKLIDALAESGLVTSKTDARRNLEQNAVKVNDAVVTDGEYVVRSGDIIQKGKRHFVKAE